MEQDGEAKFIDKDTFKQNFRDHWREFKDKYPRYDTPEYDEVVQKMLDCGDPEKRSDISASGAHNHTAVQQRLAWQGPEIIDSCRSAPGQQTPHA